MTKESTKSTRDSRMLYNLPFLPFHYVVLFIIKPNCNTRNIESWNVVLL